MNQNISLNGKWIIDYLSDQPYTSEEEPKIDNAENTVTPCNVPGYWEDMTDVFRTTALHTKLHWNPLYTLQRYPQAGYVPDMALPNPVGCFVYQRRFSLDTLSDGGEMELYIGGAQNAVSVWMNGHFIGRHEGYSTPFSFAVHRGVLNVGENRITLAVSNNRLAGYKGRPVSGLTSRAANECTGGIYGDIELRVYPDGLKDLWVSTSEDGFSFTVHVIGAGDKEKVVKIFDGEKLKHTQEMAAGQDTCVISTQGFFHWSPDEPKLYRVFISTANQELSLQFGIRRLTVEGTKLFLNREPYFFRGSCEHCYQPMTVHPTQDKAYYHKVIRMLKELGFNSIRFHTWVPPYAYMEAADELGMLMEVESPNNTSLEEWQEIIRFCRRHPAVNIYSTGNELQIDADYEKHLRSCAELVHKETDSLFSPMSAMRGIEYRLVDDEYVKEPFQYNPRRLSAIGEFCDLYNSYSLGLTSYKSTHGTHKTLDERNAVYGKPLLSHEICIHGTYCDLSLEERYQDSRIGDTEFMSSVRRHLKECGLLDRANIYYRNSAAWQRIQRKHCFETLRRCNSFAGYDFLGDIDTHWHTFGSCVGMMNEFYELKPGETIQNVLRYNSDTVLLVDLPSSVNFEAGASVEIPVLISHYGKRIPKALLQVRIGGGGRVLLRKEVRLGEITRGAVSELYRIHFRMPQCEKPQALKLAVSLAGGDTDCENQWDLYVFPKISKTLPSAKVMRKNRVVVMDGCDSATLWNELNEGKNVVLFGAGPFMSQEVSWQLSVAGRTNGHLATVIADHPLLEEFPHEGYCGRQFEHMLNESCSVVMDIGDTPHRPIIDIATSYKNVHREAMLFEYCVGKGKLLVCTLHLSEEEPAACWLKTKILSYALSDKFQPKEVLIEAQFIRLCETEPVVSSKNSNLAMNKNDITMN